jgi:heat shock protein HslJ
MKLRLLFLLALIAACAAPTVEAPDVEGDWQLLSGQIDGNPIPLVAASPITLRLEGTRVSGRSACNQYGGSFLIDGDAIQFGELSTTLMACEPAVMDSESAYSQALGRIDTFTIEGTDLVLTGGGVELRFAPAI